MTKCIMPFIHLGSKPDGVARVCCMAPSLEISEDDQKYNLLDGNIQQIWNGSYMKNLRLRIANNEVVPECINCHREESKGKRSKRITENEKWQNELWRFEYALTSNGVMPDGPKYFDLRMGNLCNLRCQTCNPLFSTEWAKTLNENNDWADDKHLHEFFSGSLLRANSMRSWNSEAFWDEFSQHLPNIKEIYVSGGEPTIIRPLWDFFEDCVKRDLAKNIKIRMNSNLTVLPSGFVKYINEFKRFQIGVSVDAVGEKNNWIRQPSNFENINENIDKLQQTKAIVEINTTLSVFNVLYLDEIYTWARTKNLRTTIDVLHDPKYMRPCLLPKHLHCEAISRFETVRPNDLFLTNLLNEEPEIVWFKALKAHIHKWDNGNFKNIFFDLKGLLDD